MCLSIGHSYSSYLWTSVSQRTFPAAKTRSSVYTRNTRETGIELALKQKTEDANCSSHLQEILDSQQHLIPTSSTSSQCTPSPVYPSGQGAHWKAPDSWGMHMSGLKQVPGAHLLRGCGCITWIPGPGGERGSVGLPLISVSTQMTNIWSVGNKLVTECKWKKV